VVGVTGDRPVLGLGLVDAHRLHSGAACTQRKWGFCVTTTALPSAATISLTKRGGGELPASRLWGRSRVSE
jgi:hypothetical protein